MFLANLWFNAEIKSGLATVRNKKLDLFCPVFFGNCLVFLVRILMVPIEQYRLFSDKRPVCRFKKVRFFIPGCIEFSVRKN